MPRPYKRDKGGNFVYIFPPRPEYRIPPTVIKKYDDNTYYGQCKFDGSNCTIYLDGKTFEQRNRHEGTITNFKMNSKDILSLHKGNGDMILCGEYMNKSKKDKNGKVFNNKYVIFDILVYEDQYLTGTTYEERYKLLMELFGGTEYDEYLWKVNDNVYLVKSFEKDFDNMFNEIIKIDMLEGFVFKRKTGKLERGTREKNNLSWSIKCRKISKNYIF